MESGAESKGSLTGEVCTAQMSHGIHHDTRATGTMRNYILRIKQTDHVIFLRV